MVTWHGLLFGRRPGCPCWKRTGRTEATHVIPPTTLTTRYAVSNALSVRRKTGGNGQRRFCILVFFGPWTFGTLCESVTTGHFGADTCSVSVRVPPTLCTGNRGFRASFTTRWWSRASTPTNPTATSSKEAARQVTCSSSVRFEPLSKPFLELRNLPLSVHVVECWKNEGLVGLC